jgi:hypothetical protein
MSNNEIQEPARSLPVAGTFDVCVIGGSCTGVFAAVRAARMGAKVALVEANGFFGGVATASQVNVWHSIYDTTGQQQIIAGLTSEVIERLKLRRGVTLREPTDRAMYAVFNSAELVLTLDELVEEAGVTPFLHTWFAAPLWQDGQLAAIAVEDKSGRRAIRAAVFIDATGDGDLLARMDLPTYKRDALQPPTMCGLFRGLRQIQTQHPDFSLNDAVFNPLYPNALKKGFLWYSEVPASADEWMIAGTRVFDADCSEADGLTRASIEGRKQVRAIADILREHYLPEDLNPLIALPTKIGIRETRHAVCQYRLREEDVLRGVRFDDAIANGTYRVDIHVHDNPGVTFRYLDGTEVFITPDGEKSLGRWLEDGTEPARFYQIPYRSLTPLHGSNVLAAGRLVDADEGAFGAVRVMVNSNQTGEAAGAAAALAVQTGCPTGEVNPAALRAALTAQGAIIL